MKASLILIALVVTAGLHVPSAEARRHRPAAHTTETSDASWFSWSSASSSKASSNKAGWASDGAVRGSNARPGQWCGWYMRQRRGGGPDMNIAWNWRNYGSASSPHVGAVVVWRHHVGEIVGQTASGQWIVRSGNDGGRVRERARSIAGAIVRA